MSEAPDLLTDEQHAFLASVFDLARDGDAARLASYLDAGVPVDLTNATGDTLLILAAYHEHAETVRVLLQRGADTARVNDRAQTALVAAVFRGATDVVRALVEAGADPRRGSPDAVAVAEHFGQQALLGLLAVERGDGS